jgi:signal transduction histidine kinase
VLADSAGVAVGARLGFCAKVRRSHRDAGGLASKWVEIPVVGDDGEISGILCQAAPRSDTLPPHRHDVDGEIGDNAQFVVHDINNLFAVIGSGLRLLERHEDGAHRKAIFGKMQEAITRGASLSRQLLDASAGHAGTSAPFVEGAQFAAIAASLDRALRQDIVVHIDIARNLQDFRADPEQLYFALLNLCRNASDAMPNGGMIIIAARNVETFGSADDRRVEIVVADDGEGMSRQVLAQALDPYFTTKAAGRGTGLGLSQVRRFAEAQGGRVEIESERGGGTVVRLLLPSVSAAGRSGTSIEGDIVYLPTPDGGVFRIVDVATDAQTR